MQAADPNTPITELVGPLRQDAAAAAVLCDVDGTLAPIVERADDAAVPDAAREALGELARSYAIVACISGRRAVVAREMVGIDGLTYVGNHGYERLRPRATEAEALPALAGHEGEAAAFVAALDPDELDGRGLRLEDKGPIRALHWRGAPDELAAGRRADEIAAEAQESGLLVHSGRMVLEIRPPVEIHKGIAVAALLEEVAIRGALYGGDDRTDLDAFRSLRDMRATGELETAVCVGVTSQERPAGLAREADVLVDGTDGFLEVLRALRPGG